LDVLAQRKDPKGLKDGIVLINGEKTSIVFRLMSGYVVQVSLHLQTVFGDCKNVLRAWAFTISNHDFNMKAASILGSVFIT